jgi:hypothetical protein
MGARWLAVGVLVAAPTVGWSSPPPAAQADGAAVHRLIDDQIAAFRRGDAAGAWRHVAPGLQAKFGTPERFLEMVVTAYRPVAAPRDYRYGPLQALPTGEWGQWLDVTGPDGERVRALYLLERQADGTWRTSGCLLFDPGEGPEPSV